MHWNQSRRPDGQGPARDTFSLVEVVITYSAGEDGLTAAPLNNGKLRDDVIRANDGGNVGKAADY